MSDRWLNLAKEDGATVLLTKATGSNWVDEGATGHTVTVVNEANGASSMVGSRNVDSMQFDGVDDYVNIVDHADFDVTDPWSIEFMIHPGTAITTQQIISAGPAGGTNNIQFIARDANIPGSERIQFSVRETAVNVVEGRTDFGAMPVNGPSHWIFVYASAAITMYRNGVAASTSADSVSASNSATVSIGRRTNASHRYYEGLIGPMAIYKSVGLTATQAKEHADAALNTNFRGRHVGSGRFSNRSLATGRI